MKPDIDRINECLDEVYRLNDDFARKGELVRGDVLRFVEEKGFCKNPTYFNVMVFLEELLED